jgi:phage shock protein A
MARQRATFGKRERERARLERATEKQERRAARANAPDEPAPAPQVDESTVLAKLETLHAAFDRGEVSPDDFAAQRDELIALLPTD